MAIIAFITRFTGISANNGFAYAARNAGFISVIRINRLAAYFIRANFRAMAIIAFITRFTGISGNNLRASSACRTGFGSIISISRLGSGIGVATRFIA